MAEAHKTFDLAKEAAASLVKDDKAGAYLDIAKAQVEADDIAGAQETVTLIEKGGYKMSAYKAIAEAQVKAGDVASAKKTAALITMSSASFLRIDAYMAIAKKQAEQGDLPGAIQSIATAQKVERGYLLWLGW